MIGLSLKGLEKQRLNPRFEAGAQLIYCFNEHPIKVCLCYLWTMCIGQDKPGVTP